MKMNWRHWHAWLSVILSLPLFLVGVTAVLLAHHKALGLNAVDLNVGWLPGYRSVRLSPPEIKASLLAVDGRHFLGTKAGLFVLERGQLTSVPAFRGIEVRSLAEHGSLLLVGGANGVWQHEAGAWRQLYPSTVHSVQISSGGIIQIATTAKGLLISHDGGQTWSPHRLSINALQQLPPEALKTNFALGKLVMDLHTGKALLGRWEWLWIDALGALLVFLCLTGVYLWWKGQKRLAELGGE
jgi:uncharacterized iron-regulated membrane protein